MKKSLFAILAIVIATLGMTSCSTTSKIQSMDNNLVILNQANFEHVRTIKEDASATYILGLVGGNPEQKAIDKLKATANLQPNQALTNFTITKSFHSIFGIVNIKTITATADVIQFK